MDWSYRLIRITPIIKHTWLGLRQEIPQLKSQRPDSCLHVAIVAILARNDHMKVAKCTGKVMPNLDDLHAADRQHAAAIAAMEERLNGHDIMLEQHHAHLFKLDETIASVRESMGRVATKDDILALRSDISNQHTRQLIAANESIPSKFAAWTGVAMLIIAILGFAATYLRPHG
jgi:hypothetical protein